MEPLLRVINLSKNFGTLPAVQGVSFDVLPGEVVGLAGRSGSGKSVLVMMLAGLYEPNQGDVYFNNQRLKWPFRAQALGIGVIHQKAELANQLDVTRNIFLGREIGRPAGIGWLKVPDRRRMDVEAERVLAQLDVQVDSLREKAANLTSEQRQMIAIARTLAQTHKLVIIDEPTLLLSYRYQQKLLTLIENWRQQGVAVIFSSNNMDHLFAVTDRIITLREGSKIGDQRTDEISQSDLVTMLVGGEKDRHLMHTVWTFDSTYQAREQAEKLRYYQMLLEKDLAAQDTLNQQLVEQLARQVRALDYANQALQDAHRRLLTEREQERKHLSRELHDQVIQDLISVNYQLESLENELDANLDWEDELAQVRGAIREMVEDLRRICGDLRPPTIDSLGLGAALQSFTLDWSERSGIALQLELDPGLGRLPEALELTIFRIIQESLNNIRKHAYASQVQVRLQHTSPRTLLIAIRDNGMGVPDDLDLAALSTQGHFGLLGISERVALLGGSLSLKRPAEGGTLLQVEIPHPRVEKEVEQQL
jgi:signal transduction histidine kinase